MAIAQTKDGRWYVAGRKGYWPDEPDRTREYFGRGIIAEQAARRRDAELGGRASVRQPDTGPTFYELAIAYLTAKNFSENSLKEIDLSLRKIILPIIGHRRALRLEDTDMDLFVDKRRKHRTRRGTFVKDSTIRRELTTIKAILNWAVKRRPPLIAFNPVAGYQSPAPDDAVIIPPTPDEVEAIYQAASEHLRRCIILAYYLGLRPGAVEMLSLTWADVSLGVGVIRVRSAHKGGPRFRDVPINPGLKKHLQQWYQADKRHYREPVGHLIKCYGKPIKTIQTSWEGALERAGIKRRIRPYDIRHAFASRALEAGADIGAVSQVMGSAPETIRRHYQHVSRELTRRTIELIPELDIPDTTAKACCTKIKSRKLKPVKD